MKKLILFIILLSESHSKQQMKRLIPLLTYLLASMNVAHAQVIDEDFITKHTYTDLTKALKNPEDVYGLDLSGQELAEFPMDIFLFKNLWHLNLGMDRKSFEYNHINTIPKEIIKLRNLRVMDLSGNNLKQLPDSIGYLSHLEILDCNRNSLVSIPSTISQLSELKVLVLSNNQLENVPRELGNLTLLNVLAIEGNKLKSIPEEIGNLNKLTKLYCSNNHLETLPLELIKLKDLQEFVCNDNPFETIPNQLLDWLSRYNNGNSREITEIISQNSLGDISKNRELQESNTQRGFFLLVNILLLLLTLLFLAYIAFVNYKERFSKQAIQEKADELNIKTIRLESITQELIEQRNEIQEKNQKLEFLTEELQQQRDDVVERSNELEALTEELRQQNEVVESTNQILKATQDTKDLMISAVNHDLRNPLNPIINFSHPDYPGKTEKERLAAIHIYSGLMLKLINDIMQVYKADKLSPQISPSSPHRAVHEAIAVMSLAQTRMPKIINEIPVEMQAMFDAAYIERVFENFLSNAIKYTPSEEKGGLVKFIATPNVAEKTVRISIQDNGKGIPKDKLEEIFLPFVNPDAKSIGGAKSVGIGLTFCKTVIEAHNTKIEVSSEVGKGTTFSFVLPYVLPESKTTQEGEEALIAVMLSEEEQAQVATHITQIKAIGFRNAKLKGYLENMEVGEDDHLQTWKETLIKVIKTRDKKVFQEMMG